MPAVRAINDAMADLEQLYPDAIPTALREETITRYGGGSLDRTGVATAAGQPCPGGVGSSDMLISRENSLSIRHNRKNAVERCP